MEPEKRNEGVKYPFSIRRFPDDKIWTWLYRRASVFTFFSIVNLCHIGLNKKENKDKKVSEGMSLQVELDLHMTSCTNEHGIGRPGGPVGTGWATPGLSLKVSGMVSSLGFEL